MRVSDIMIKMLVEKDVEYIFGISAGTVSSLFDASNNYNIKVITTKNEAGAAYSATKYADISNKLGVCIVAGGVGVNNAINGIADAMRSKAPVLIISGNVHRWQIGKGAIQELNTENILKPITKYSRTILDENEVVSELDKAIKIAMTPPCGPVYISVPIDIQIMKCVDKGNGSEIKFSYNINLEDTDKLEENDLESVKIATNIINEEEFGLIMVGRGCRNFRKYVIKLSKHLNWPIITTPQAKGIIPTHFELNLGNYGFSSADAALDYVENSNYTCLLVLGSSLGESATRNYNDILFKNKRVIHVDWDKSELNKVFNSDVCVHSDLGVAIPFINENTYRKGVVFSKPKKINEDYINNHTGLSLRLFLEEIVNIVPQNTFFISDIGEYMNLLLKYLPIKKNMGFNISLNYGAMGSGVGGALGAYLALPESQIAVFVGDGSFFMNGMEILTSKHYKMPIIYFVINNAMLAYVEHGHKYLYGRTLRDGFVQERISIAEMGRAIGIRSMEIRNIEDIKNIKGFISNLDDAPCIIELITDGTEKIATADRFKALNNSK
jgi:acetolactate synthase-1/2/3 large subunit